MTPYQYCQKKLSQSNTSFYYSFLFLEPLKKKAMTTLYAFCREVDDVVDDCSNKQEGERRLLWWEDEIERIFQSTATHPVGKALQEILPHFSFKKEWLQDLLKGMKMDLDNTKYQTFSDLELYCYRVASTVGLLSTEIFGYQDHKSLEYAKTLGIALQLVNIIRDIGEDADRGRIYIPSEELTQFSLSKDDILNKRESNNFQALMQFQENRAIRYYQNAKALLPKIDKKAQQSSIMMAAIYFHLLEKIKKEKFPVFKRRVRLSSWQKLSVIFSTFW